MGQVERTVARLNSRNLIDLESLTAPAGGERIAMVVILSNGLNGNTLLLDFPINI